MQASNTLIIGDSHGFFMAEHLGKFDAKWTDSIDSTLKVTNKEGLHAADLILLNGKLNFYSRWLHDGIVFAEITPNFTEILKSYNNQSTTCFLLNHGNKHNAKFMCTHSQPFDFFDPRFPDKLILGRQIIPISVIYKQLETEKPVIEVELQALKSNIPLALICFVAPPPPIPSEEHIKKFPEIFDFNIHTLEDKWVRLKIYKIYLELLTDICNGCGIKFLLPPSETLDEHGFLKENFWNACTHASSDYYEFVIQSAT